MIRGLNDVPASAARYIATMTAAIDAPPAVLA
jgi:hypothetical protein